MNTKDFGWQLLEQKRDVCAPLGGTGRGLTCDPQNSTVDMGTLEHAICLWRICPDML